MFDQALTKENYKEFEQIKQEQKFSIAVAEFGLLLSNSDFKGSASYQQVIDIAKQARGTDQNGYRAEFIRLAETAQLLDNKTPISLKKVEQSKSKGILVSYPRTPEYPGGIKNLRNELKENINIKNCCPNSSEGIIVVRFLLKKNGRATSFKILKNTKCDQCETVVIEAIKNLKHPFKMYKLDSTYFTLPFSR